MQAHRTFIGRFSRQEKSITSQPHRSVLCMILGALVIISPLLLVCSAVVVFQVQSWNLPGVTIFDQDVGWKSQEETTKLIDEIWNQERYITLVSPTDPGKLYQFLSSDLGYWVDPAATAKAAFNIGRTSYPMLDLHAAIASEPRLIMPILFFDEDTTRENLSTLIEELTVPAQDASLFYQDETWFALPGLEGQTLDIEATIQSLKENSFTNLLSNATVLQMKSVSPQLNDLNSVLDEIEQVISQELSASAYDPITDEAYHWLVSEEVKRSWVTVDPETYHVQLSILPEDVEAVVASWESDLRNDRFFADLPEWYALVDMWQDGQNVQFSVQHSLTSFVVSPGESLISISFKLGIPMWRIIDANPGLTTDNLTTGMILTIPSKNILLPLPVVPGKRIIINISEQQMQVLENGQIINIHPVSTGVADSPTMTGIFQIQTHELNAYATNWNLYMPHFMGIYEAWPGFMNGIHGLPLLSNGHRLWASTLGRPASYGCIILDLEAAESLYNWADTGVVVEINP